MISFGSVPIGSVLPVFFGSYDGATGASEAISGLAVADIEIYKGVSMTQRASDAGYTLLDTDGIDVDGTVGINAVSIDTGDDTDAGFFAAGSFYTVVVSSITADGQTVNFVAATFRLTAAEATAGVPVANTTYLAGQAVTAAAGVTFPSSVASPTNITAGTITTVTNLTNAPTAGDLTATMKTSVTTAATAATPVAASVTGAVGSVTGNVGGNVTGSVGSVVGAVGSVTGAVGSVTGLTASDVAAIKAKTDSLTFTVAGQVDANIQYVNDVAIQGTGAVGSDEWRAV